ncbi:MAG: hypothetical protein GXY48_04065 [Methanomicrobiales archaeon]|nr:hypothetical protein [Methanomicrobiales archaeon]
MNNLAIYTKIKIFTFLFVTLSILIISASATIFTENGDEIDADGLHRLIADDAPEYSTDSIVFFYDPECGSCIPAHEYLESYIEENPDTLVIIHNIDNSQEDWDLFNEFKNTFNREKVFVPVIYIGPVALEGHEDIEAYFNDVYAWYAPKI